MMTGIVVVLVGLDVGDDDVGDDNSRNLHDDLLLLSVAHPCLLSSSVKTYTIVISTKLLSALTMRHLQWHSPPIQNQKHQ